MTPFLIGLLVYLLSVGYCSVVLKKSIEHMKAEKIYYPAYGRPRPATHGDVVKEFLWGLLVTLVPLLNTCFTIMHAGERILSTSRINRRIKQINEWWCKPLSSE